LSHGEVKILDQVNLTIMPGEKIGIIGPSGAGKSTLLRLLDLYLEPNAGRILIDGHDIQSVSLQDLRRSIAWISQSPQLFASSIIDNMRDGDINRTITPEEIAWASDASNISEFLKRLPAGLDSVAGETGSSLSGGQRQRIAIARALLKNASIICMDEPTSALDEKSEKLIVKSIGLLIDHRTVLLVTHRLPLLSLMDKVYVLKNGKLQDVNDFGGVAKYTYQLQMEGVD
jgi:ABC-type multidrug transport system fused ATPase/permease subunit